MQTERKMDLLSSYINSSSSESESENEEETKAKVNFFSDDLNTESSSDSENEQNDVTIEQITNLESSSCSTSSSLPLPSVDAALKSRPKDSVYTNKYDKLKLQSDAVLEQHVKMVENKSQSTKRQEVSYIYIYIHMHNNLLVIFIVLRLIDPYIFKDNYEYCLYQAYIIFVLDLSNV